MNKLHINWEKLSVLPDSINITFEKFCFHIVSLMMEEYGTLSYFYNTPGSEFYVELNKPWEYEGIQYSIGDIIGWQVKYWSGKKDEANSPLDSKHKKELLEGFEKTNKYRPQIRLWIICTPGSFVQRAWDAMLEQLQSINSNCKIISWHKDIFEGMYIKDSHKYNGIFQYYFGSHYIDVDQINEITKDTLSVLNKKFDVDLHSPSEFEKDFYAIVDDKIANSKIKNSIVTLKRSIDSDKKKDLFNTNHREYNLLSDKFISVYIQDYEKRQELAENLYSITKIHTNLVEILGDIRQLLDEYIYERKKRVKFLNEENKHIRNNNNEGYRNVDYYLSEFVYRVQNLEKLITDTSNNDSLISILNLCVQKDFAVFAEAGYGKTHFACSIANVQLKKNLPVLFLTGSRFRHCDSSEKYICEILHQSSNTTIDDVFDSLDFIAYINKCKLPIIIDGLNETFPNENRWINELPSLVNKLRNRSNLLLITTCREKKDYVKTIYDCENFKDLENWIQLTGLYSDDLASTVQKYFGKYGIQPINHHILSDFSNPLLLKMFCECNKGLSGFILDEHSLASCMEKYSDNLINSISTIEGRASTTSVHKIKHGLNSISHILWEKNERHLNYITEFAPFFDEIYLDKFLTEGMCFMLERNGNEVQILFSYDMLAGYHIAKSIVNQCVDKEAFVEYINNHVQRLFGEKRHPLAEDITKSLFYLVPIAYGDQWFRIMPLSEIIMSGIEHMDIIVSNEQGRNAIKDLLKNNIDNSIKQYICNAIYKRIMEHDNLAYLTMFIDLFSKLSTPEWDEFWNCRFTHYATLEHAYSLLHDKYIRERFNISDCILFAACMCGITDKEYRVKFHTMLQQFVMNNTNPGINAIEKTIYFHDPLIFESVVSAITGLALRIDDKHIWSRCVNVLETFLNTYSSNHIVLLDNLDTLYSFGEYFFKVKCNREILYKNKHELWVSEYTDEYSYYDFFSYDFDKYNIRPFYTNTYNNIAQFDSKEIYGRVYARINSMGYDKSLYIKLQNNEYQETKYRSSLKISYSQKYGRHAALELYGWMLLNGYIKSEYKNTFRTSIISIDPSCPIISPMRTYNSTCFLPKDISTIDLWLKESNIEYMKAQHIVNLPKHNGEWILLNGSFSQKIDDRFAEIHLYGTSIIVPIDDNNGGDNMYYNSSMNCYDMFAGEIGWRNLESIEEYTEDTMPQLLSQYCFSGLDADRFKYKNFYMLNPKISRSIGIMFNINEMSYYMNNERVSVHYVNETDHFFFLRKDVVDTILKKYNAKLHFNIYEHRMLAQDLPQTAPKVEKRFVNNETDVFYVCGDYEE